MCVGMDDPPSTSLEARFERFVESYFNRDREIEKRLTAVEHQLKNVWKYTSLMTSLAAMATVIIVQIILKALGL